MRPGFSDIINTLFSHHHHSVVLFGVIQPTPEKTDLEDLWLRGEWLWGNILTKSKLIDKYLTPLHSLRVRNVHLAVRWLTMSFWCHSGVQFNLRWRERKSYWRRGKRIFPNKVSLILDVGRLVFNILLLEGGIIWANPHPPTFNLSSCKQWEVWQVLGQQLNLCSRQWVKGGMKFH